VKAVILAAGKGTRLLPYTNIVPKALMLIGSAKEKPITIIERLIMEIVSAGITDVFIVVNFKAEMIKDYLDGAKLGCKITYVLQEKLDGNGGAFYRCQKQIGKSSALIVDCDNYFFDSKAISKMKKLHERSKADLSVAVAPVKEISKYAIIKASNGKAVDIYEKPTDSSWGNLAKSGLLMLSASLAAKPKEISKVGGEYTTTQIIKYCLQNKLKTNLYRLEHGFSDIGTWNEYFALLKNS